MTQSDNTKICKKLDPSDSAAIGKASDSECLMEGYNYSIECASRFCL
jgi:hypothetical protein